MDKVKRSEGKLAVLMPGFGAVATTFVAGVEQIRRGKAAPIGSLTQMGTVRLGPLETVTAATVIPSGWRKWCGRGFNPAAMTATAPAVIEEVLADGGHLEFTKVEMEPSDVCSRRPISPAARSR